MKISFQVYCGAWHNPIGYTKIVLSNSEIYYPDHTKMVADRYKYLGNFKMNNSSCNICQKKIITMYDLNEGWNLYCDDCYKREIL